MNVFLKMQEMNLLVKNTNKGGMANGVYTYKIIIGKDTKTGKIQILK